MNKTAYGSARIRVLERAIGLLEVLGARGTEAGVTELGALLSLHKSTVHRLLVTLEEAGFVEHNGRTGKYRLGLRILHLGSALLDGLELRKRARPHLEDIQRESGETVHLATLDQSEVVYVDKIEGTKPIKLRSDVGRRAPLYCTGVGKVLLAHLPPDRVDRILGEKELHRFTAQTIISGGELRSELDLIRRRGYAIDNAEHEEYVRCVAAPVRDHTAAVVAAASITFVGLVTGSHDLERYIQLVVQATARISRDLGYAGSPTCSSLRSPYW